MSPHEVSPNSDFTEGILPLDLALDKIWKVMIAAVGDSAKKANLATLREVGVPVFLTVSINGKRRTH